MFSQVFPIISLITYHQKDDIQLDIENNLKRGEKFYKNIVNKLKDIKNYMVLNLYLT